MRLEAKIGVCFCLRNEKVYSLSKEMDMLSWVMGDLIGGVLKGQEKVAFFNNGRLLKLLLIILLFFFFKLNY
jgi:hypothetical protein